MARAALATRPKVGQDRACQEVVLTRRRRRSRPTAGAVPLAGRAGAADHLAAGDHPPAGQRADGADNVGVYRMQVLGSDRVIMRWLAHRGGAKHHHHWRSAARDMPVAIAIGADPATILSAVLPLPETLSEIDSPACCAASGRNWRQLRHRAAAWFRPTPKS